MKRLLWNRHTKLVLKHAAGWFCIAAGIIMLVTPGQGLLSLLLGVYLLADHVPMFGRLKVWLQRKFPKATDYAHRQAENLKSRFHQEPKP